jgi:hypothetical protein
MVFRLTWHRMHVFADIRPYICTFSCKDALCTFATRNDWAEHEFKYHLGRNSWPCPKCPATSDNADELRSHLVEAHLAAADPSMLKPTITPIGELKCPLCQKGLGDSKRNYISHVAKHMESIALAALPPDPEDISDDDSNGAEKVGSILTGRSNTVDSIPSSPLQKMDDFPGTHSQRHSFTATNSYDLKLSTRIHPSVWQASFHMPSASSDAPSRPYSLEGSALYNPTPMDFQGFGTCQFPGRDIPGRDILFGAESNFHMNSTAGIASPPSGSFTTGPPPFSLYATAEDKTSASFTSVWNPRSFSHGSVMHNLSTIDDSPTVLDHPIKFLDSQLSFPTPLEDPLRQLLHPQITSSISPLDYSTGLERLSPSVTGNPVGPQQSKVASNSRKHRLNETSETSDKSFKMADRFSLEIDNTARDHSLYQNVTVHSDGLYHCPWEGQDGCQHRPEKLKCNYEYATPNFYSLNFIDSANNPAYASQFVDLHLKPYRCKDLTCENLHFSSPACLRRHEGKAHAMHGYGDKPFLCTFKGCERGVAGNGFPRHWNLRDHIKRVHPELGNVNPYI